MPPKTVFFFPDSTTAILDIEDGALLAGTRARAVSERPDSMSAVVSLAVAGCGSSSNGNSNAARHV